VSVTVVAWASAFVAIRGAGQYFDPGALALGRLLAGSLVLGAVWLVRGEGWPPRAAWPGIAGAGVLWFGVYMVALNWGERHVDAGTAAMIINIGPVVIAVLGGWLLQEGFPRRLLAGLAVSFAGAAVVAVSESGGNGGSLLGVGMCLLAAVSYAIAVVGQKPALRHASALQVTTFGCFAGTVATLPFAAPAGVADRRRPSKRDAHGGLPGRRPHRAGVHHLSIRAEPHHRRQDGRDDIHRARPCRADVVGVPRRDPAPAGLPGWGAVPGRRGDLAQAHAADAGRICRGRAGQRRASQRCHPHLLSHARHRPKESLTGSTSEDQS
jgi:hypothetical protein